MNRKTLIALAMLGALTVIAIVVLRQPEKGERVGERPRPVPKLAAGSFDALVVTKANATTVIKKDGDKFKVVSPVQYPADDNVAKQAFEAVEKLEFGDVVSDQKAKHAEFELGDGALKLAIKKGDQVLAELLVGKSVGGNTLVRLPGKDEVWTGLGSFRYNFDRDTTNWRDKTITKFTQSDAEKIEVKGQGGARVLVKSDGGDKWSIVESTLPVPKLDDTIPQGIASALASLSTNEFADDAKPADTGLADPTTTVTVSLKGGKTVTVLVGKKKGADDTYLKTADAPQVFLVKRYNIDRIEKRPIDFRDKSICDIAEAELGEVAVTHDKDSYALVKEATGAGKKPDKKIDKKTDQAGDWKATKPAGLALDPAKVSPVAGAFKDWKAAGFAVDQSPKENGLVKPKATIIARSKDKKKICALKIGDESKDKINYAAQAGSSPDVYLVAKWATDRILVKVEDLRKK
jgi:Domain of unknown function (DUF4340)